MPYEKFGLHRHKPAGQWVQATLLLPVVGIGHSKAKALAYAHAVKTAERRGLAYGLNLVREPNNPHDPNAIAVMGVAEVRGIFGGKKVKEWRIGYVDQDTAQDVTANLIGEGVPVSIELYSIYVGAGGYIDVKYFILAPPGYGHAKRSKR